MQSQKLPFDPAKHPFGAFDQTGFSFGEVSRQLSQFLVFFQRSNYQAYRYCPNPKALQSRPGLSATPARPSSFTRLRILTLLHVHLSVVLFTMILLFETARACSPAPFIFAIQKLLYARREMHGHMAFEVVSAGADVGATGV